MVSLECSLHKHNRTMYQYVRTYVSKLRKGRITEQTANSRLATYGYIITALPTQTNSKRSMDQNPKM